MAKFLIPFLLIVGLYAQEPYKIGPEVSAPVPIYKLEPAYTQEAKEAKLEGTVVLSIVIDSAGKVSQANVMRNRLVFKETGAEANEDLGLAKKAVDCVVQWKFKPAQKDGKPVAVKATVEMNFRLM